MGELSIRAKNLEERQEEILLARNISARDASLFPASCTIIVGLWRRLVTRFRSIPFSHLCTSTICFHFWIGHFRLLICRVWIWSFFKTFTVNESFFRATVKLSKQVMGSSFVSIWLSIPRFTILVVGFAPAFLMPKFSASILPLVLTSKMKSAFGIRIAEKCYITLNCFQELTEFNVSFIWQFVFIPHC